MTTLVALHAHPDDESSKGAATVARYHDAGVRTVLVCATGGEAGDVLNPNLDVAATAGRLPELRRAELEEAARIIGYDEVILLGYRDSGMPGTDHNAHADAFVNVAFDEVLEQVVAIVRRERPAVVLGYDDHEHYPHPDHLRVHELSKAVFAAAADPGRFPAAGPAWAVAKLYAPVFTHRRLRALHDAAEARGIESPYGRWLDRFDEPGEDGSRIVTRVDVTGFHERARRALLAHRTQIDPDGGWFALPTEVVEAAYPFEDFELLDSRVAVDGSESDLFAGLSGALT